MACKVCDSRKKFDSEFETDVLLCELLSVLKCDGLFKEVVTKETAKWWKRHKKYRKWIFPKLKSGVTHEK